MAGTPADRRFEWQEVVLRARVLPGFARRRKPWKSFRAEQWYEAEWENEAKASLILRNGKVQASWPSIEVEVRAVADDQWEIRAENRMDVALEGQMMQIPGRVAECPYGHARSIPTRFDAPEVQLKCVACGRAWRLVSG